jgi:hypothetical protein
VTPDEREQYEERAAIVEYHGCESREVAEDLARREIQRTRETRTDEEDERCHSDR